jgi:CRISPR-associated endonuclease Cas1 subtype II
MSWRTIVISQRSKLDYSQGYLVCRGEQVQKVHLSEIHTVIVESTAVSLTAALLCELVHHGVKVIFCDEYYQPQSELVPYAGCYDAADKLRQQLSWSKDTQLDVWTAIVRNKIVQQAALLRHLKFEASARQIEEYLVGVEPGDPTNREAMAARIHFNTLFEKSLVRNQSESSINKALNYGYAILLSTVNREIAANGYVMQLGIHHIGQTNPFNLGCDLMEPWRPVVDGLVYALAPQKFETEEKRALQKLQQVAVMINGEERYLSNAVEIYCRSVFRALAENDISCLAFYERCDTGI